MSIRSIRGSMIPLLLGDMGLASVRADLREVALGSNVRPGVEAKCERLPWPRLKPWFDSVWRLKAAKSGLESNGICLGDGAAKDRMEEVGGLQLSLGRTAESPPSAGSTMRPK